MLTDPSQEADVAEESVDSDAREDLFAQLTQALVAKRKAAIDARSTSGVEKIWATAENSYNGKDEYNAGIQLLKGAYPGAGITEVKKAPPGRSTVIPNITRPYTDAAAARVADMLLPSDSKFWGLKPTPDPELIKSKDDKTPVVDENGQPLQNPSVTRGDLVKGLMTAATEKAKRAETVIDDYLVECNVHAEIRETIESAACYGTGILKGPYPVKRLTKAVMKTAGGVELTLEEKIAPESINVSVWDFFPAPNCGERIQDGGWCFEREEITALALMNLKGVGYLDDVIAQVMDEGPIFVPSGKKRYDEPGKTQEEDRFELWHFHGALTKDELMAAGCECEQDIVPCSVIMVNDQIIKAAISPLNTGELPYSVMVWQRVAGQWAGLGVPAQIETCQKSLTGAVRAMQDNQALSSGPQIIVDSSKIEPVDGKWHLHPNKLWKKVVSAEDIGDVRQAFTIISIETRQVELLNSINYWTKAAEDVTGLPMLLQGQQGGAPDTLGATEIINNNGSTVLRRIARTFDDQITEPLIQRYYEWLLLRGPDDAKGDFQVDAQGSTVLVERHLQNQALMQLLAMSLNPAFGLSPEKVMGETLKSMRIDATAVQLADEEKEKMAQTPPPKAPAVQAAEVRAGAQVQVEQIQAKEEADHTLAQARLELQKQAHDAAEAEKDRQLQVYLADISANVEQMRLSGQHRIKLDDLKAMLATASAKLNLQERLSNKAQVIEPVVEPKGKAPEGEAFVK